MEGKMFVILAVMSVALVCAVPGSGAADKLFKGEKTGCRFLGVSGKIACHKELTEDCDMPDEGNATTPASTAAPTTPTASASATTKATTVAADNNNEDEEEDKCKMTAQVEFSISSIQEYENDTAIDTDDHSHTFVGNDFVAGDPVDNADIPNTGTTAVKSTKLSVTSTLENGAEFVVDLYIAKADGKVTMDGEELEIKKDMMKFSIQVSNWAFCTAADTADACDGKVGDKLEMEVEIKSRDAPVKDEEDASMIKLGGDAILQLSSKVQLDDTWADMEEGYPKITTKASKHYLVVRFNKFTDKAYYDPTIDFGNWDVDGNGPISGAVTSYVTSSLACLLTVLAAMFV